MTTLLEELSVRARALEPEDRVRLAEDLLASLHDEPQAEVEGAWELEIQRRLEEVTNGSVRLIPSEEVHAEARKLYR
jgi:putative addiction module component (TIGR02574 family)